MDLILPPDEGVDERRKGDAAAQLVLPPLPGAQATVNAQAAVETDPDHFAQARKLAGAAGLPVPTVERNFDAVAAEQRVRDIQSRMATNPVYARQMLDPDFAKLSAGDEGNLNALEQVARTYLGASVKSGLESLVGAGARLIDAVNPFTLSEEDAATLYKSDPEGLARVQDSPAMFLVRFSRAMQQASERSMLSIGPEARASYGDLRYATLDPSKAAYLSPIKIAGDAIQSLPTTLALGASAYLTKGVATRVEAQGLAAGMTPLAARQAAVHAASETMARLGAATGGAAGYGQQAMQTREQADRTSQETLDQSPEYQARLADGYSPAAARLWVSAKAAEAAGVEGGAIDAATNLIGGAYFGKLLGEGGKLLPRVGKGMATEGLQEAVQSGFEQFGQNAAVKQFLDPAQSLLDGVAEQIAQGFVVGGVMGGAFSAAAGRARQVDSATHDAATLQKLFEIASDSKLRERTPQTFAQFVQSVADEGPVPAVYIDANAFLQTVQKAGMDESALRTTMPETAAQIDEARQTGGRLRIPLGEMTATFSGTGLEQPLLQELSTTVDGPTLREAHDEQFVAETKAYVDKVMAEHEFKGAIQQSAATVERELLAQLTSANRFTGDVNSAYAKLAASFYTVQAARLGITPEQMYVKYPLQIRAESVLGATLHQRSVAPGALTNEAGDKAVLAQTLVDRTGLSAEYLAHVFVGQSVRDKSSGSLTVPTFATMLANVRSAVRDDSKILDAIVSAVPVDVVDNLFGSEIAAKEALHNEPMFKDGLAVDAELPVAQTVDAGSPIGLLLSQVAHMATEAVGGSNTGLKAQEGSAAKRTEEGNSLSQGSAKATYAPESHTIALLAKADLSSFLHELGHFQLEVLADIAGQPEAPPEVVADMAALLKWFGVPDLATWNAMTLDEKRPHHEQLARGFEAYLFEGKAPSQELNGVFSRFRAWLLNVYRQLASLNVTLTDEVRGVFDRLLATNSEILAAETARGYAPLFESAEKAGMTPAEWSDYQALGGQATQDAVDNLQTRSLRDMQWLTNARSKALKQLQAEAADKRKALRAEVAAEVNQQPVYQALQFLTHGIIDGEQKVGGKLSLKALKEMYGEGPAAPWRYLNAGKYGTVTSDIGLHPDQIAELFGFTSGDELVRKILDAEPANAVIEAMTDQRMLERYGDLSSDKSIERAANEAVHNEARARFVATELNALAKATGQKKLLVKAAKEFADTIIARKKLRDIRPAQYEAAEARAAKAAERALGKNNLIEAATEKRNQLVNFYAAKAAREAQAEVDKAVGYLRKIGENKSLDPGYREQITALLERFDLRKLSGKAMDRRASLLEWVESQREQGFEPVIDPELLNEANRVPFRELPLEQFRGVVDAVRNIEHLGRLKHKLLAAKDQREFKAIVDEAAASIVANAKRTITPPLEPSAPGARVKSNAKEFFALHRKFSSFVRELDGYKDTGALWNLFLRPMNEAGNHESTMREAATVRLTELFKPVLDQGSTNEKRFIPQINDSLSREGRIMVALNTGNEGNLQRLMDGEHWTVDQVQAIVNTLTKTEMDFVQGVWDYVETYRAQIGAQQKRLTGIEPEWVEPIKVQTPHGEYRGGYIPVKYDTTRSTRSLSDEAASGIMDQWRAARGRAKTRDSFTKARAGKVMDRALRKDFGVITQHITEVTHRLAWQEFLVDSTRLLRAPAIDSAIREHYGHEVLHAMRSAIEDIAAGEVGAQNAFERAVNYVRTGATIAGLGWRLTTALLQPIGLTQSMVRIGPKWVGKGLAQWIGDAAHMENTAARIYEKSEMMRLRGKTLQREISEIRNQVSGKSSAIEASYFYLIQKLQLVADIPTWLGQYEKAIEGGAAEDEAVAQADAMVLEAQGGGQLKDLAGIQRGGPMLKLFTNFYSFFNTTYNLLDHASGRTDFKNPFGLGRLAVDVLLLTVIPAALGTLMKALLHAGDDGWDWDKLKRQLAADQLNYLFGTIVGLREMGGTLQGVMGLPGGDYQGPASVRLFADLSKLGKQISQGEADEAFYKALDNATGVLFHYPAGQINATADGLYSLATGKSQNPGALAVGSSK